MGGEETGIPVWYELKMGAYASLWAALSPEVKIEDGGRFGMAWGIWHPSPKKEVLQSMKIKEEGGTGLAVEFRTCARAGEGLFLK
jgi:hypothetical protein